MSTRSTPTRSKPTPEAIIEDRAGFKVSEQQRDDDGNTIEDTGLRIGTPTPDEDKAHVIAVMDAIDELFTDNEERTSQRTGEVYISNKRAFPGKMMLRQFIRQFDFDLTGLKKRIFDGEEQLARLNRRINVDDREKATTEMRIEEMVDAFAARTAMRRHAVAYYPELTGEYYEQAKAEPAAQAAPPMDDYALRAAARKALING